MAATPASVVHQFTAHPGDIIPYTPSKSNGVGPLELGSEARGTNAMPNEGESTQAFTIKTVATAATTETASEQPRQILSPPMKAQVTVLQAFESPRGFPLSTYNFAGRQFEDSPDQTRRPSGSLHTHIPEQVGVVSGAKTVK